MALLDEQESQFASFHSTEPGSLEELRLHEVSDSNVEVTATQEYNNVDHSHYQKTDMSIDNTDTAGSGSNALQPECAQSVVRESEFADIEDKTQPANSLEISHNILKDGDHMINAIVSTDQMVSTNDWPGCTPILRPAQECLDCPTDFQFAPAPSTKMNLSRPIPGPNSLSQPGKQMTLDNTVVKDAASVATKQDDPILLDGSIGQSVTASEHVIDRMKILQQHKDVKSQTNELASKAWQKAISEPREEIESNTSEYQEKIAENSLITRRPFENLLKAPAQPKTALRSSMLPNALGHRNFAEFTPCGPVQLRSKAQEGGITESLALLRNPARPGRRSTQSKPFPEIHLSSIEVPIRISSETPSRPFVGTTGRINPPHKRIVTPPVQKQTITERSVKNNPSTSPNTPHDLVAEVKTDSVRASPTTCRVKHHPVIDSSSEPANSGQIGDNDMEIVANVRLRNSVPMDDASSRRENRSQRRQVLATRPMPAEDLQTMNAAQSKPSKAQNSPKVVKASQNKQSGIDFSRVTPFSRLKTLGGQKSGRAPSALDLFTAVFDRFELEQEQSEQNSRVLETQAMHIQNLTNDNDQLEQHSIALSSMNKELKDKFESLQFQADEYGEYVNRFAKGQKYLEMERQKIQNEVDSVKAHAAAKANAAVEKIQKMEISFSRKSRATMEEARLKMDQQETTIELLRKDIESRLNDLQREKGIADRLQKQLDDRLKFEDVMKGLMVEHHSIIMTQLSGRDKLISKLTVVEDENQKRLTECLALVNSIKNASPQVHADLKTLSGKIESLSACVMTRAESDDNDKTILRSAGNDVIKRFDKQLEQLKIDGDDISKLNESLAGCRELNAGLSQKLQSRDTSIIELKEEVERIRCELAVCHDLVAVKTEELKKFAGIKPEDPHLRPQLKSLDETCSRLRAKLELERTKVAKFKEDLNNQQEVNASNEQKIKELRTQLQQEESKIVELGTERVQILKSHTAELEQLRVEINRNFQSRCDEDKYRHASEILTLQNEKSEAEARHALQLVDLQTQRFEVEKQFAAQLKSSKEQNHQLEKEMLEAETLRATQLKDLQAQMSEVEQRCSLQIANVQKEKNQVEIEKTEVETHYAAQLANVQLQKEQLEKERSEVETRHAAQLANIQTDKYDTERRCYAQLENFGKEQSQFEKSNAEIETRHATQLASLHAQKSQLEKEKSEAEIVHASQLADLQMQKSEAEKRCSVQLKIFEEQKLNIETLYSTKLAGFETQKCQADKERDEAEAYKLASNAKLSEAETELGRLKQSIMHHKETAGLLHTRLDSLELDIKSNTIEIKARHKEVQVIQELCNDKETEIQLLRDEGNQMKADLVVWEKKFTDGQVRSAEFLNDYRAEKKRIGTEANNLILHAERIDVTVDQLFCATNSRRTQDSNTSLKKVGRVAPLNKQLARLKNSTTSSKTRNITESPKSQHFIKDIHTNHTETEIQSENFSYSPSATKEGLSYSGASYRSNRFESSTVMKPVQTPSEDMIPESQDNMQSINFALARISEGQEDIMSRHCGSPVPAKNYSSYTPSQEYSGITQIQQRVGTSPTTSTWHDSKNNNPSDLNSLPSVNPWTWEVDRSRLQPPGTPEAEIFDSQISTAPPSTSEMKIKQVTVGDSRDIKRTRSILKNADNNRSTDESRTHSIDRHAMFELPPTPPIKTAATTGTRHSNMAEAPLQAVKHAATTGKKRLARPNHSSKYNRAVRGKPSEVADVYGYPQSQIINQVVGYGSLVVPNSKRQPIMEAVNQLDVLQGPRIRSTSLKRRSSTTLASDPLKGDKRLRL